MSRSSSPQRPLTCFAGLSWLVLVLLCTLSVPAQAAVGTVWAPPTPLRPALRDELSLNGTWTFTPAGGSAGSIAVPEYWDAQPGYNTDHAVYQRQVTVDAAWAGKRLFVEFEGVNHIATVSINGTQVGQHIGGWVPFRFDVSGLVTPGAPFTLTVDVLGGDKAPIWDTVHDQPLWPIGWYGNNSRWGIVHPVWLRAYGVVAIDDAFVQPSFRNKQLVVDYTITNRDSVSRTVNLAAQVKNSADAVLLSPAIQAVTLVAGASTTVRVSTPWADPLLWFPDQPNLLKLDARLSDGSGPVDGLVRQFGFREVWVDGNQYRLNGVRLNLRGTSVSTHTEYYNSGGANSRYNQFYPANAAATIDGFLALNHNVLRFHMSPMPDWVLDLCDQKGMMVIAESAIYGSQDHKWPKDPGVHATYMSNAIDHWLPEWTLGMRNHPSVVYLSVENEYGGGVFGDAFNGSDVHAFGDAVSARDPTLPRGGDGDVDLPNLEAVNWHYPEGYGNAPSGSIYSWHQVQNQSPAKPVGVGEFITSYGANGAANQWWMGTWCRGMRYNDFADIRPYITNWALNGGASATNLRNCYAPVALFDKDYDDLGLGPVRDGSYPGLSAGASANRTLVLYNDAWRDPLVTVTVAVKSGSTTYANGSAIYALRLGDHLEIPCSFQVPYLGGGACDVVLSTSKGGVQTFSESKRFTVSGANSGSSSATVTLGGSSIDPSKPFLTLTPPTVSVTAQHGQNAAGQTVAVGNGSAGTLANVQTSITYGSGGGWLSATRSGSGNAQSLALQFSSSGLGVGTYTATVNVSDPAAVPSSAACAVNLTITPGPNDPRSINAGGQAVGSFAADAGYSGGGAYTSGNAVTVAGVANAAPAVVYQTSRYGAMTYTIPGLAANSTCTVRLHFAESYFSAANSRLFNVDINGSRVLTNFDIYAAAGAKNKAVVREFIATANASGQVVIVCSNVTDNASINGIEVIPGGSSPKPGDADGDGVVDAADLAIVTAQFGRSGADVSDARADLDGNGRVDAVDLGIVTRNQGR